MIFTHIVTYFGLNIIFENLKCCVLLSSDNHRQQESSVIEDYEVVTWAKEN